MAHLVAAQNGTMNEWPINAISRSNDGVFRDAKGRIVKASVGMDSFAERDVESKIERLLQLHEDREIEAQIVVELLMPSLVAAVGKDEQKEQEALGTKSEDESTTTTTPDDSGMSIGESWAAALKASKDWWNKVSSRNRKSSQWAGSTGRVASPAAVGIRNGFATDSVSIDKQVDAVERNAKAAKQYSEFTRF